MANKEEVQSFSIKIENLVEKKCIPYMEAIILYCQTSELEVEVAAKMLSGAIKSKLRIEAEDLNFLPRSNTCKLPI
jgi:hypothetical protein